MPQGSRIKRTVAKTDNRGGAASSARESGPSGGGRRSGYAEESKQAAAASELYDYGDAELQTEKVTTDMKMDLVAKVKKLSNEGLTKLVKHVQSVAQVAMTDLEDERV